jgi:alanyl-tRNA synthetase
MNMNIKTADDLRSLFLRFFKEKGHAVIPSASLIPENDPTVLFTTAGMHPLVPYLLGTKHPMGTRLTDVQKCIRTGDIEDVGDASHLTFFEMLGNWSLGDYFKKEAISWSWEFLTSPNWLGLDRDRLAFSVFAGDADAPRDDEAADLWRKAGVADDHIFYLPKKNNWWGPAGITGPRPGHRDVHHHGQSPLRPGLLSRLLVRAVPRDLERRVHAVRQADRRLVCAAQAKERRHRHGPRAHVLRLDGREVGLRHRHL